jgi:phosphatidylserine/phosphatidylglycerophosphate/cardiolipin synthase-like enzyme
VEDSVNKLLIFVAAVVFASCGTVAQKEVADMTETDQKPVLYFDESSKTEVLNLIENARQSIHVEMFQLGDENVIEALADAAKRGIDVKMILSDDSRNVSEKEFYNRDKHRQVDMEEYLEQAGCQVKWIKKRDMYSWHRKIAVFDRSVVFMGSTNWTRTGFENNSECNVRFSSATESAIFESQFDSDFSKASKSY